MIAQRSLFYCSRITGNTSIFPMVPCLFLFSFSSQVSSFITFLTVMPSTSLKNVAPGSSSDTIQNHSLGCSFSLPLVDHALQFTGITRQCAVYSNSLIQRRRISLGSTQSVWCFLLIMSGLKVLPPWLSYMGCEAPLYWTMEIDLYHKVIYFTGRDDDLILANRA